MARAGSNSGYVLDNRLGRASVLAAIRGDRLVQQPRIEDGEESHMQDLRR